MASYSELKDIIDAIIKENGNQEITGEALNYVLTHMINSISFVHKGEFNAGNITEEGWYDQVTAGRPAGSDDDEHYLLYMSTSKSQICFSKKNSSKIYYRASQEGEWQKIPYNVHKGEFNANDITEEGWYDSIVLGRPEGSESDEKYFLYMSSNGGQTCFSRRNSGKAYHRLGLGHPWVALTHDDYAIENALAAFCKCCSIQGRTGASSVTYHTEDGYALDANTNLSEFYAGNNNEVKSFLLSFRLPDVRPNDLIRVRCAYRRGFSAEGAAKDDAEHKYPFDSDAYIFFADEVTKEHDISKLRSNWIKVKSLGGQNFPFTDAEKGWQDLAFMRNRFFNSDWEYGWHYLRITDANITSGYLNIYGDFSTPGSWFVFDMFEVYRAEGASGSDDIYYSDINAQDITNGAIAGALKDKFTTLRREARNSKFVALRGGGTYLIAPVISFGSTFNMSFFYNGRSYFIQGGPNDDIWMATLNNLYIKPQSGIPKNDLSREIQGAIDVVNSVYFLSTDLDVTTVSLGQLPDSIANELDKWSVNQENYDFVALKVGYSYLLATVYGLGSGSELRFDYSGKSYRIWVERSSRKWYVGVIAPYPSDPQSGITDANQLVQSGFTGYVDTNTPAAGWGSLSVRRATTADGAGYWSVEQTFYGRGSSANGKIWQRLGFVDAQGGVSFMNWILIGTTA